MLEISQPHDNCRQSTAIRDRCRGALLGLAIGSTMVGTDFLKTSTLFILVLGLLAFCVDCAAGRFHPQSHQTVQLFESSSACLSTSSTASRFRGLVTKSYAPSFIAATAASTEP